MKVVQATTIDGKTRYLLEDKNDDPVLPVLNFLKFKDNSGSARNSLRSFCYNLKLFFEFLDQEKLDYSNVGIDEMAAFLRWLQSPYRSLKVTSVQATKSPRKATTINTIMSTVLNFYDYIMRHEDYSIQVSERLKRTIAGSRRGFKDFLYHVNKDKQYSEKVLKLKTPKSRPKTITKEQAQLLVDSCVNIRDKLLIQLLWETGMRIGEALSLWLEDFEIDAQKVHVRDRGELENGAEIKTVCSPRVIDISPELINFFMEYVVECHTDNINTNHVFIVLRGDNKGQPLNHNDIYSLFRRLKKKTGIEFISPHKLRHSHFTNLKRLGWAPERIMKRITDSFFDNMRPEKWSVSNKTIDFNLFPVALQDEVKFFFAKRLTEQTLRLQTLGIYGLIFSRLSQFLNNTYPNATSFIDIPPEKAMTKWRSYLIGQGVKVGEDGRLTSRNYETVLHQLCTFFESYYDNRDEFEKDIWDVRKIPGAKFTTTHTGYLLNFSEIPKPYRALVKKYIKIHIGKCSQHHCRRSIMGIKLFLVYISKQYPNWTNLNQLSRSDIEFYLAWYRQYSAGWKDTHLKYLLALRTFFEYIQRAQYPEAPTTPSVLLIWKEDMPRLPQKMENSIKLFQKACCGNWMTIWSD